MQQLFGIIFTTSFAYSILRVSTPLILAGMAAVVSERAGVANIAIEGMMLISALTGVVISAATQNCFVGVLAGVAGGMVVSLILAYFILQLKANNIMCGLAVNAIAKGGTVFV
ncbi:MAG: ABC transporter permease, partial [Lachnospiraceae bacterium]|nr:ABC transporter permease [Lachnospiraceae bacterium]